MKDSELKSANFKNLKNIETFNDFMELDKNNQSKLLNHRIEQFMEKNGYRREKEQLITSIKNEVTEITQYEEEYIDLPFDYRHCFIKISEFDFQRGKNAITQEQIIKLNVSNGKITWNKFNKDVLFLIIFKDLFLILDKIVLKDSKKDKDKDKDNKKGESPDKNDTTRKSIKNSITNSYLIKEQSKENSSSKVNMSSEILSEQSDGSEEDEEDEEEQKCNSQMTFNFSFNNPQFVVQNELKGSALLLICKEPIKVVFTNYSFRADLKDYTLNISCRQLSLYSVLKSDKKDAVVYWMGDPKENKYHLSEKNFGRIIVSPRIDFRLSQNVQRLNDSTEMNVYHNNGENEHIDTKEHHGDRSLTKNEKDEYDIITRNEITIDKIDGNFNSVYFSDFMNIVSVLIFDRGFSFSQEKTSDNQIKEDMKKYKNSELEAKIKQHLETDTISNKVTGEVKFNLIEVTFNLCEDIDKLDSENKNEKKNNKKKDKKKDIDDINQSFKPLLQFQMKNFIGDHTIREDKSSETRLDILQLLIKNVEHEMSQPVFQPLVNSNSKGLENRLNMVFFKKKDRYVKLESNSLWYVLDEFEFNISPFAFHISKKQIVFILDFFFHSNEKSLWDEDKKKEKDKNEGEEKKEKKKEEEVYPMYFRQFKINEIRCLLNFEYAEAHPLNVPMTRLKFHYFTKHDKFYPLGSMINRFVGHCKKELIKNFGNIISGLFSTKDYSYAPEKKEKDEEAAKRKLLFGDK